LNSLRESMSFFLIATLLLAVEDKPLVVVTKPAEAARLDATSERVIVLLRDHKTLVTVLEKAPNVRQLEISHGGH
ncbi:MAG: hypothetical protein VB855_16355, partial [Pirellulaceae bacterium]